MYNKYMIRNTFRILNGVGPKKELRLWRDGVLTWDDFLRAESVAAFSSSAKSRFDETVSEASERLSMLDARYCRDALVRSEHCRLFALCGDDAVYLDIETNGLPAGMGGYPTVVGISDRNGYSSFIRGEGLNAEALMERMKAGRVLVTFYGSVFDIPFLERTIPGFRMEVPHFDLCFGLRRVGLKGGLKGVEQAMGIVRDERAQGMDGYDAVRLWDEASRGSSEALDLLVLYNREDTVNLMRLAPEAYAMLRVSTGIAEYL
jgi:uncharacterized protein YprB with RNaseH-like and TPR domain